VHLLSASNDLHNKHRLVPCTNNDRLVFVRQKERVFCNIGTDLFIELDLEYSNFPRIWAPTQNSRGQKSDMTHVSYSGLTDIRRYRKKFSRHCDQQTGIYAPLIWMACLHAVKLDDYRKRVAENE
jgi:hypothetical protein